MLVVSGGAVNFLNMRSLQQALGALRKTTQDLAQARQGLEQRVEMRTSQLSARAEQFQAIAELNRELAGVFELDELLNTAVHFIVRRLDFYHVGIFFLDDTGKWMQLRAASSEAGKKMVDQGHKLAVGKESLVGRTAATARSQVVGDVERTAMWYANPNLPETHSEMVLPLVVRGDLIGALDIQSQMKQAFSEEDVQTLSVLADGLAVFIENTRLITQSRYTLERLQNYQEEEVVSGWRQALRRRHRDITYVYDRVQMLEETPDALDLPGEMADLEGIEVVQRDDGAHVLMAPVRIRQRALGVMLFESQQPWSDDARRLAADVTEQLGLALENARLLEETRFRATQERARSEIVGRVRASVQVDAILRSAAQELGQALQVERTRLQLVTPERDDTANKSGDGR
jgi:GAF domain-containing protein